MLFRRLVSNQMNLSACFSTQPPFKMNWTHKPFDELTAQELYAILQLRNQVFVVEQNCVFQDADNKDPFCDHLMCTEEFSLIAYSRILPPGISGVETSIGRILTAPTERGKGLGKTLMLKSIELAHLLHGPGHIRIGAQLYLINFYESFGFQRRGPIYLEDNIEHIEMILNSPSIRFHNLENS